MVELNWRADGQMIVQNDSKMPSTFDGRLFNTRSDKKAERDLLNKTTNESAQK